MKNQTLKWILIAVVIIVVLVALYFLWKSQQPAPPPQPGNPPAPNTGGLIGSILGGILNSGWIKNLFGGGSTTIPCDPANPGYDVNGNYTAACGGTGGGGGANCDPNRPGYDMNGFLSTQCGA